MAETTKFTPQENDNWGNVDVNFPAKEIKEIEEKKQKDLAFEELEKTAKEVKESLMNIRGEKEQKEEAERKKKAREEKLEKSKKISRRQFLKKTGLVALGLAAGAGAVKKIGEAIDYELEKGEKSVEENFLQMVKNEREYLVEKMEEEGKSDEEINKMVEKFYLYIEEEKAIPSFEELLIWESKNPKK